MGIRIHNFVSNSDHRYYFWMEQMFNILNIKDAGQLLKTQVHGQTCLVSNEETQSNKKKNAREKQ